MMMLINQYPYLCLSYSTAKTNINKNKQENPEIIVLNPVNQLMMIITIT